MKITKLLFVLFVLGLSACSGEEKSFYLTNDDVEITSVNCTTKNARARVNFAELNGYSGGDLRINFEMIDDNFQLIGEGEGELLMHGLNLPDHDKFIWIDFGQGSPITKKGTSEPYNIYHFCDEAVLDRPGKCQIRITYYEMKDETERKVGYEHVILLNNY